MYLYNIYDKCIEFGEVIMLQSNLNYTNDSNYSSSYDPNTPTNYLGSNDIQTNIANKRKRSRNRAIGIVAGAGLGTIGYGLHRIGSNVHNIIRKEKGHPNELYKPTPNDIKEYFNKRRNVVKDAFKEGGKKAAKIAKSGLIKEMWRGVRA